MAYGFFDDILKADFPEFYEELHSEQSELSLELINFRLLSGLTVEEFSEKLNITFEKYIEFELGNVDIPVSDFKHLIELANKFVNNTARIEILERSLFSIKIDKINDGFIYSDNKLLLDDRENLDKSINISFMIKSTDMYFAKKTSKKTDLFRVRDEIRTAPEKRVPLFRKLRQLQSNKYRVSEEVAYNV